MNNQKNVRKTGLILGAVVLGVIAYSLAVIKTRGSLDEPKNMTHLQRILRGL